MNILHHVSREELLQVVSEGIADAIVQARAGETAIISGAGGIYGRLRR
jgi:PHP family Zn ribbon phosphoesterase